MMRLRVLAILILASAMLALLPCGGTAVAAERALVLEIDGAIGPPLADYIVRELRAARPEEVGIVILRMNTPGGLDTSMRQIVSAILASPVPVASASLRLSMARITETRSVVGDTSTVAEPAKDTSPRLIRPGSTSTNFVAAFCMAWKRVGSMSVAFIDSETSSAIITVARSRGTRTLALGAASETTSVPSASATRPNARCRFQPGRFGTIELSSATLVNRAA